MLQTEKKLNDCLEFIYLENLQQQVYNIFIYFPTLIFKFNGQEQAYIVKYYHAVI